MRRTLGRPAFPGSVRDCTHDCKRNERVTIKWVWSCATDVVRREYNLARVALDRSVPRNTVCLGSALCQVGPGSQLAPTRGAPSRCWVGPIPCGRGMAPNDKS